MNELELDKPKAKATPKPKAAPKAEVKPQAPKMINIVSPCGRGAMSFLEGSRVLEDVLASGWKVK